MPLVNGKNVTPDEAIAQGRCPECGDDFKATNPIAHRKSHWKTAPPPNADGDEARRRMALFDKYIVDNNVRTSNMQKPAAPAATAAKEAV
jgi:hypothetical protein